jgi:hypothetical protein
LLIASGNTVLSALVDPLHCDAKRFIAIVSKLFKANINPFKDEVQTALFKYPIRTAL